ncbi:MAG TPA: hypothetical protein VFJ47_15050 [Terriglobales bacterium]|nr:hypothetical protein [Terriglobales bacterium]
MGRWLTWVSDQNLQGWACSQCEWSYPLPSMLSDPEAKSAFDRLAASKFQEHDCAQYHQRIRTTTGRELFAERARKLVMRGYKPKDAVELVVQEIILEHRNEPKKVEQARADAEDFLRRVRQGLI